MLNLLTTIYNVKLLGILSIENRLKISTALVAILSHFYDTPTFLRLLAEISQLLVKSNKQQPSVKGSKHEKLEVMEHVP
jgi:hypothetical protein